LLVKDSDDLARSKSDTQLSLACASFFTRQLGQQVCSCLILFFFNSSEFLFCKDASAGMRTRQNLGRGIKSQTFQNPRPLAHSSPFLFVRQHPVSTNNAANQPSPTLSITPLSFTMYIIVAPAARLLSLRSPSRHLLSRPLRQTIRSQWTLNFTSSRVLFYAPLSFTMYIIVAPAARLLSLISLRIPSRHLLSRPLRQTIRSQWTLNFTSIFEAGFSLMLL
jgi:hypothetical protein